jgi:hypothetical protein
MALVENGLFKDGKWTGQGSAYIFDLYAASAAAAEDKGYIVPEGAYEYSNQNANTAGTFGQRFSKIKRAANAKQSSWTNIGAFTEGKVTITKRANGDIVIKAAVKGDDGKTYRLRYQGGLRAHSFDFSNEPLTTGDFTRSYAVHSSNNHHDKYSMGADYIDFLAQGNNERVRLAFLLMPDSETLPSGELKIIKHTTQVSAIPYVEASEGWKSQGGEMPSTFAAGADTYFLQSGTVTITAVEDDPATPANEAAASTVTVEAVSYFGSTIKVIYTGTLTTNTNN